MSSNADQARLAQLFKAEGLMPTTQDPERFSFWVCIFLLNNSVYNLVNLIFLQARTDVVYLGAACYSNKQETSRKIGPPSP